MKTLLNFILYTTLFALTSCSTKAIFPVSDVAPAAHIIAQIKKEISDNYTVTLKIENLSSPKRLSPSKKYYVIWMVSSTGSIRNVGFFINENAEKVTYKASFPYEPADIFITGEDEEGLCKPTGLEIARVTVE